MAETNESYVNSLKHALTFCRGIYTARVIPCRYVGFYSACPINYIELAPESDSNMLMTLCPFIRSEVP